MKQLFAVFTLLASSFLPAALLLADEGEIEFETERVVVFKDGYALIIKRGKATADERGELHCSEVPDAAVLGTFWATNQDGSTLGMRAAWVEETENKKVARKAQSPMEILLANKGRKCTVQLTNGESGTGKIRDVLTMETGANQTPLQRVNTYAANLATAPSHGTQLTKKVISATHFILAKPDTDVLYAVADVRSVAIEEMRTALTEEHIEKSERKQLSFLTGAPGKEAEIVLTYFRPGLRWIPTYRIDLPPSGAQGEDKVAHLSMQAEILNEAEDFIDCPIDIVVGVPNFRFRNTPSPLALESVLRNALNEAEPALMGLHHWTRTTASSRHGEIYSGTPKPDEIELAAELGEADAHDLYVHSLPGLRLRKGERAALPVISKKVPVKDIYTWDLHVQRTDIALVPSGAGVESPLAVSSEKIWHQIELENNTGVPWTTGAAIIMQGQRPLAQELLTFTARGVNVRVPVTVSSEIQASFSETETGRKANALTFSRDTYTQLGNRAQFTLQNAKPVAVELEITARFGGRIDAASDGGEITLLPFDPADWQQYRGDPTVNNSSVVLWKQTVEPGETFAPSVDYHYFTR